MIFHDTDWSSLQERSLLSFMTCDIGNLQTFKGHCLQRRIAVSKWIEKSFERLRSEEYSCRILRIMSLSVRQLDNVSILERVSFFYRFLGFLSIFWLGYYAVPVVMSHELLISVMEGKTPTTCGKMSPSQSHLLRFWSFGAFVWSFGRCPKWRWIFHVVFFLSKCWKWTSSLLDVTGTFVGDTFVDWDHWWIVAMERSWYLKGVGSHWCEIRITEFQSNVTNHDFQELQHAWKASKTQDGGNSLHSAAALCPLVSKSGDKQWTWYYLVLFIYFWKLLMGTICLFFWGCPMFSI